MKLNSIKDVRYLSLSFILSYKYSIPNTKYINAIIIQTNLRNFL